MNQYERIIDYVEDWKQRYDCATPTAAIGHEMKLSIPQVETLVEVLIARGLCRWHIHPGNVFKDRDVALIVVPPPSALIDALAGYSGFRQ